MYETDLLDGFDLRQVTRITVVTEQDGRAYEEYDAYSNGVVLRLQDDGRTLKIFPRQKETND